MANKIQLKRGLKSRLTTLSAGEPAYTTDTRELYIGTGSGNVNLGGSQWYTGTAMSGTATTTGSYSYSSCPLVKLGDMYLNTTNGNVYQCTTSGSGSSAKWTYKGSIRGATGPTGATGTAGTNGKDGKDADAKSIAEYLCKISTPKQVSDNVSFFSKNLPHTTLSRPHDDMSVIAQTHDNLNNRVFFIEPAEDEYETIYDYNSIYKFVLSDYTTEKGRSVGAIESAIVVFPAKSGNAILMWHGIV